MVRELKKVKGTKDYFGQEQEKMAFVFFTLREIAKKFNYKEIDFSILEHNSLFYDSIGSGTDIVSKEMFKFVDKKGREIVLRPEGTASTVRMSIENKLLALKQKQNFFYIQKMFRYERPQKGRLREFYQFGIENFNHSKSESNIEIILFGLEILESFKIDKYYLEINNIGSKSTREKFEKDLKNYLKDYKDQLSDDSKLRLEKNVLRILDSKDISDQKILLKAPKILNYLNEKEKYEFEDLKNKLTALNIKFKVNSHLVRGLDYYNDFVFEFISTDEINLGAKSTILGGGRYDNLVNKFDKKYDIPAIGFALGIERLVLAASDFLNNIEQAPLDYYIVLEDKKYELDAYRVAKVLRSKGKSVALNLSNQKLNKKILLALKKRSDFLVIIDESIKEDLLIIKNLKTKEQKKINIFKN